MIDSSQHTSTITCSDVPRVWHFSAFHIVVSFEKTKTLNGKHFPPKLLTGVKRQGIGNQKASSPGSQTKELLR